MTLEQSMNEIDRELDALGNAPRDVSAWVVRHTDLDEVDRELDALTRGVTYRVPEVALKVAIPAPVVPTPRVVVAPTPRVAPAPAVAAPAPAVAAPAPAAAAPAPVIAAPAGAPAVDLPPPAATVVDEPAPATFELAATAAPDTASPLSAAPPAPSFDDDFDPFADVPRLSMSEPPRSQPPGDGSASLDPFEGKPAPMPIPQRAKSVPAPSMSPPRPPATRTIRTSAAPPPPLPSMRPRRPSDTPDPFAPPNRASSRPPAELSADQLFGGVSMSPTAGAEPIKMTAPPPPKAPPLKTVKMTAPPESPVDDFEVLDDELLEIDVEEVE